MNSQQKQSYDHWKLTDTHDQSEWDKIFEREWVESMVRSDHPTLDEEDIAIIVEERIRTGYYDGLDF
jgi:hypothetical protein